MKRLESYEQNQKKIKSTVGNIKEFVGKTDELAKVVQKIKEDLEALQKAGNHEGEVARLKEAVDELFEWKDQLVNTVNLSDLASMKKAINSQNKEIALLQQALKAIKSDLGKKKGSIVTGSGLGAAAGAASTVLLDYILKKFGGG